MSFHHPNFRMHLNPATMLPSSWPWKRLSARCSSDRPQTDSVNTLYRRSFHGNMPTCCPLGGRRGVLGWIWHPAPYAPSKTCVGRWMRVRQGLVVFSARISLPDSTGWGYSTAWQVARNSLFAPWVAPRNSGWWVGWLRLTSPRSDRRRWVPKSASSWR